VDDAQPMIPMQSLVKRYGQRAALEARAFVALLRAGAIGARSPVGAASALRVLAAYGPFGAAPRIAALRDGRCPAICDEGGEIDYACLDELISRVANALHDRGLAAGDSIGILCRNHRWPLVAAFAASRAGMRGVWLNTAFSARQAQEVARREGVALLIHDADLADVVAGIEPPHGRVAVAIDDPASCELAALAAAASPRLPPAPSRAGRIVLLTSGTSGTPKGAPRPEPRGFIVPGSILERLPMRARQTTVIAPPLFHGTGLLVAVIAVSLSNRLVLRRRFEAQQLVEDIERWRASTVCLVPIMLQRLLALGDESIRMRDLSSLRIVFCGGSALPAEVALHAMDLLGEVVYNLYGSTEVAVATLATPADVRAAPNSVGRPALGSRVKIFDDRDLEVAPGRTGRIFVGTTMPFEGYTGGGGKETIDGLLATGDLGHFDAQGRLYIDGREDEMIVSGGENVFPAEVEELLLTHPGVAEAAVVGVHDEEFGQRLRAFVVAGDGPKPREDELKQLVKDNLARYKAPREVVFLDELPRNPAGKVLKRKLLELEV
jgi:fatty-acyl-CoA synthase